jgi:hypothetical protein
MLTIVNFAPVVERGQLHALTSKIEQSHFVPILGLRMWRSSRGRCTPP